MVGRVNFKKEGEGREGKIVTVETISALEVKEEDYCERDHVTFYAWLVDSE